MAYMALYREWRPRTFGDVVGQEHVTITLKNQINNERIAHAYLLCGTRGTGKTSTAKILAKAVNCLNSDNGEPCNECEMCKKINAGTAIDVTELDAASHNGVDNIRDIIEDVQYPPQEAKYKVYIIDEVHMLSIGAVNAFLKTLEEPPSNIIFILATTDPQKLPITILSRCQRFDFKRIRSSDIFDRLRKIVTEQGVFAEDNSLKLISRVSDGAMRDALSILDQAISMNEGSVEYDNVVEMLGLVTNESLIKLSDSIIDRNIETSIKGINDIVSSGKDVYVFIKDMTTHMRNLLMVKVSDNAYDILDMSSENIEILKKQAASIRIEEIMRNIKILQDAEQQAKWSKQNRIYLELAVIKMCKIEYDTSKEVLLARLNKLEEIIKQGKITVACESITTRATENKGSKIENKVKKKTEIRPVKIHNANSNLTVEIVKKSFKDILDMFKTRRHMVIYASLMTGEIVSCNGGVIELGYEKQYAFNKIRLEKEENKNVIEEIFSELLKEPVKIKYTIEAQEKEEKSPEDILKETFGEDIVEILDE
ncbi:DNA polymerase III subunit gamma/tau [Clostridium estertheticum]|uniref:DNA polymerase III subunit gamma/tau n=1 Tax=Clostridium estertheticum TaxID=238834 RepID=UPI001CF2F534|nr:DNA polymerase III subunit gamma/tau [Clostridium estertheticum]MCB2309297.1 DNA polymerase III subunit gamma/tau [Clostridium estertheticum]MCB2347709.1 DNA polymerase III subunit gamma/tau [Clostridium estertheticum]MCB2352252.1 DNA polymerase III subunit gamma/tau [Clostridium estertheticum]WAG46960.1 DNA polymerase III subunit gamma/tau [Clostridium estertheticum]